MRAPRHTRGLAQLELVGGYPTAATIGAAYEEATLNRALQAYRFFYPTVSGAALMKGNAAAGVVDNRVFSVLDTKPRHVGFTYNSDTPYGAVQLNLREGPYVVELPPGALIVVALDMNQRWIADMGIPGPDAGEGGKHLILPPDYHGEVPGGYHIWHSTTFRMLVGVRALPVDGDVDAAMRLIRSLVVRPLSPTAEWIEPKWIDLTAQTQDTTPLRYETTIDFWNVLHEVVDSEPPFEGYREYYGELAALGIEKGKPFEPDARMRGILEEAARLGHVQMCVQSFADRRPDRGVWSDRQWEWVGLRPENGDFDADSYTDLVAREVWFYQAIGASPAMFRRQPGSGSLYWLGLRDAERGYLDGGHHYRLTVPLPVPAQLFWSVTVYDAETRSQIQTDQEMAALRSQFELRDATGTSVELRFGPDADDSHRSRRIKTIPGKGWFAYFRIYGPQQAAFDGSWRPGDFELLR